jgi:Tfp pilus assembly protein PilO
MKFTASVIAVLVALVLTLAFWFLLYKPAVDQQAEIEAETEAFRQQAQSLQTEIAQLRDIESRQVEIRAAFARLEEFIPTGSAQPSAIRQFQRAADAAGTEITTVTFGAPAAVTANGEGATPGDTGDPGTSLATISIAMTVQGGYFQLVDFFRRVEVEVPRAVLVESLAVTEGEATFPQLAANWTGEMYAIVPSGDIGVGPPVEPEASTTETPEEGES